MTRSFQLFFVVLKPKFEKSCFEKCFPLVLPERTRRKDTLKPTTVHNQVKFDFPILPFEWNFEVLNLRNPMFFPKSNLSFDIFNRKITRDRDTQVHPTRIALKNRKIRGKLPNPAPTISNLFFECTNNT